MKKKKDSEPQVIVAYLKVSPYLKAFMQRKYGKVIRFPFTSQMYAVLYKHIVCNADMKHLTEFSYSEYAFNYQQPDSFFVDPTHQAEKDQFIPIELPVKVFKGPYEVAVNRYWQLSSAGAKALRKLIKEDFMMDMFEFIKDCMTRARLSGTKTTKEQAIDDFISINGIDMSWRENFWRYTSRDGSRIAHEIENRRNLLEESAGFQLCYT